MEWPKGPNPDPKTGSSKTEQSRGNFRKKRPRANMLSSVDSLKERVNPHIPLLKPGNVAELLVFKARVSDHLRESFILNGNCLQSLRYDGKEALTLLQAARTSVVRMDKARRATAAPAEQQEEVDKEADEEQAVADDEDDGEGYEDDEHTLAGATEPLQDSQLEDLNQIISTLPERTR